MAKSKAALEAASRAGRALSKLGAAKGGKARAEALDPARRSEIAQAAAASRWGLPKATHEGTLVISDISIPCAVLSDGRRVLSQRGVGRALGRPHSGALFRAGSSDQGGDQIPFFIAGENLKPFISEELRVVLSNPILYVGDGGRTRGVDATVLPQICEVWLKARDANALRNDAQKRVAAAADAMVRGFARIGIIALVDEVTGYQADRARDELTKILEAYIAEELRPWMRVFPDEFFRQVYRLQGWDYKPGNTQGPRYVGKLINEYIYKRLPPGVLEELQRRNPAVDGRRKLHHHRLLTEDTGVPHLDKQIVAVVTLMKVSTDNTMFQELLTRAFPKKGEQMPLSLPPAETATGEDE
jgi:hypothetical protein